MAEATAGVDHPVPVPHLAALASLAEARDDLDDADARYRRIPAIRELTLDPNDVELAVRNSATSDLSAVHLMELYAWLLDKLGRSPDATEISARPAVLRAKVA